jgi:recombination protein RecT
VPRKKKICLEISYRGFVQLATDIGAIKWAHAEVVCEQDKFELRGYGKEPFHSFNPFDEARGDVIGAYCVAKTHDGDFLTTHMSAKEVIGIRDRSESYKSGGNSPWLTDRNEMIKKTVIRRAYKSWPMTDGRKRFDTAVDVSSDFDPSLPVIESGDNESDARVESLTKIRHLLSGINRTEEKFIEHLSRQHRREIKTLEELTPIEITQSIAMLTSFTEPQFKKEMK